MALIYWKDSLDFENIMGGVRIKMVDINVIPPPGGNSPKSYMRAGSPPNNRRNVNLNF